MVHLAGVPTDKQVHEKSVGSINNIQFPSLDDEAFTASVYGSKYASQDLPKHEMPEGEMPKEIAYRMIKCVRDGYRSSHCTLAKETDLEMT
jgi:glutamate decarboxylase